MFDGIGCTSCDQDTDATEEDYALVTYETDNQQQACLTDLPVGCEEHVNKICTRCKSNLALVRTNYGDIECQLNQEAVCENPISVVKLENVGNAEKLEEELSQKYKNYPQCKECKTGYVLNTVDNKCYLENCLEMEIDAIRCKECKRGQGLMLNN